MFSGYWDCYPSSDDEFEEILQMFSDTDYSSSTDDEYEATSVEISKEFEYLPDSQPEATLDERSKRQKKDEDLGYSEEKPVQRSKKQKKDLGHSEESSVQRSKKQKKYDYFEQVVPTYSDTEFLEHFRLRRQVAEDIAEKYRKSVFYNHQAGGNGKLIPLHQILVFLWFTGHETDTFRNVAERFNISASTLCLVVRRVINFFSSVCGGVIKWPSDDEKVEIESHFRANGLPGVVGVVGVTHIKIDKPQRDPSLYLNQKRFYSVRLQVVSDHKRRIRDIFVGNPGSTDDETTFRKSPLFKNLEEMCGDLCIVGDSTFPCLKHLLTPYTKSEDLTGQQKDFNTVLSRNTSVVEHCLHLLKLRFRQLLHIKLRNMEDIVNFIQACCILHNIAIEDAFVFEGHEGEHDKAAPAEEEEAHDLDIQDDELGLEKEDRMAAPFVVPGAEVVVYFDNREEELGLEKRNRIAAQLVLPAEDAVHLDN